MVHFELCFERNWDLYHLRLFVGKTEGAECTGGWKPLICQCTCARMMHQPQVHGRHESQIVKRFLNQKPTETSLHTKTSKKALLLT